MRTTLTIDDDMLDYAKAVAAHERKSVGEVVTAMMRSSVKKADDGPVYKNGIRVLPSRGGPPVTLELVNRLRDEAP